ncbi:MAG TPA: hypothetical protein VFG77_04255 [Nitrososphaeraceae archaeon]|nr:hypothetical protein [Nitrososphaeraceae archaeon]
MTVDCKIEVRAYGRLCSASIGTSLSSTSSINSVSDICLSTISVVHFKTVALGLLSGRASLSHEEKGFSIPI